MPIADHYPNPKDTDDSAPVVVIVFVGGLTRPVDLLSLLEDCQRVEKQVFKPVTVGSGFYGIKPEYA